MTLAEWRAVLAVNLDGTFLTLRDLARHMVEAGTAGKLVAVSSMVEHFGSPTQPHYAASKGGVGALVRSFGVRLGKHGIQVNALEPGWIETGTTRRLYENERFRQVAIRRTPLLAGGRRPPSRASPPTSPPTRPPTTRAIDPDRRGVRDLLAARHSRGARRTIPLRPSGSSTRA